MVFHLAGHLAQRGHTVTVITRNGAGKPPSQEGVNVIEVGWLRAPMAFTRSYGKRALRALKKLHANNPVDVVHAHLPLISWTRRQFRKVHENIAPVVSSLHGSWLGERDGMKLAAKFKEAATWRNPNDLAILLTGGWYSRYERAGVLESAACVANSEATKQDFIHRYIPPENWRCETVLWGVDHLMFHPLDGDFEEAQLQHEAIRKKYGCDDEAGLSAQANTSKPLVLAVGRLVARKGFLTLLTSMPRVIEAIPDAKLVIVGRGHMKKKLLSQAKSLGVVESVMIESGMSFEDLAALFRSADLVAYPSYYEGQGLIPLEAMSSGTPVVTIDNGPLPEMVDDEVGSLAKLGDPSSLAEMIITELSNPQRLHQKAIAGRERVLSGFTYEHNAAEFERIFNSVINY